MSIFTVIFTQYSVGTNVLLTKRLVHQYVMMTDFDIECNIFLKYVKYIQHINLVALPNLSIRLLFGYLNHSTGVILERI